MQQIDAVIDQFRLREIRTTLETLGVEDFMESKIQCHQQGLAMKFRGATLMANFVEKVKLEIIAEDESVSSIVEAIGSVARTGDGKDCRISIHPYLEVG